MRWEWWGGNGKEWMIKDELGGMNGKGWMGTFGEGWRVMDEGLEMRVRVRSKRCGLEMRDKRWGMKGEWLKVRDEGWGRRVDGWGMRHKEAGLKEPRWGRNSQRYRSGRAKYSTLRVCNRISCRFCIFLSVLLLMFYTVEESNIFYWILVQFFKKYKQIH